MLPFTRDWVYDTEFDVADDNGFHMVEYDGVPHYNPVTAAVDVYRCLETYMYQGGDELLDYSIRSALYYFAHADTIRGAVYYPYHFDFELHGNSGDWMIAPWYSGMAQGLWLGCFARLYHITGDEQWHEMGLQVLPSLLHTEGECPVCFVSDGFYWIDEYPQSGLESKTWTLNGMMYAMYGLYEWWWVFDDLIAEELLRASLATIKEKLHLYRVQWGTSYYCLRHKVQSHNYHNTHVKQLLFMHLYSNDTFFAEAAITFFNDHH